MQKQYRFYVDNGADAIVGHHTHCIGGYEVYNDAPIIYSLGNFLFTLPSQKNVWYEGLISGLLIENEKPIKFEIHPIKQQKNSFQLSLLDNKEKEIALEAIKELNSSITDEEHLQKNWKKLIDEKQKIYFNYLSPVNNISNQFLRTAFLKAGLKFLGLRYLLYLTNIIRCQAHADILNNVLNKKTK
jgi:poly-gamma-glutamate synthesis protein (capsule biosynthesis protein)